MIVLSCSLILIALLGALVGDNPFISCSIESIAYEGDFSFAFVIVLFILILKRLSF